MTTKSYHAIVTGLFCIVCAAGALVWTGCDTSTASSTEQLVITPAYVTLSSGQSQTFKVSGGYHYTWSLEGSSSTTGSTSTAQGTLSSMNGSEVLYTAPSSPALSGSVIVHVTSTIEGSGAASSNAPNYEASAEAVVTFK